MLIPVQIASKQQVKTKVASQIPSQYNTFLLFFSASKMHTTSQISLYFTIHIYIIIFYQQRSQSSSIQVSIMVKNQ